MNPPNNEQFKDVILIKDSLNIELKEKNGAFCHSL